MGLEFRDLGDSGLRIWGIMGLGFGWDVGLSRFGGLWVWGVGVEHHQYQAIIIIIIIFVIVLRHTKPW